MHEARDQAVAVKVVTATDIQAYDVEEDTVFIDAAGNPVTTVRHFRNIATPAPQPKAPAVQQMYVQPPPVQQSEDPPPSTDAPPPPQDSASPPPPAQDPPANSPPAAQDASPQHDDQGSSQSAPSTGPDGLGFTSGITYTPYNADHSCKTEDQVAQDLKGISAFQVVRLYGTDCDQVAKILQATGGSVRIWAGVYHIQNLQGDIDTIASAVNGNWKNIVAVSIGNELVNSGQSSAADVVNAVNAGRTALRSKGFQGPVLTVDTMIAMQNNPQLCQASDVCGINCHAFFDGNVEPSGAGKFVADWVKKISEQNNGKTVVVTESGWPSQGTANKIAVPSLPNQQTAMKSLVSKVPSNLIQYTLYHDMWKTSEPVTFHAEQFWGIKGMAPSA